MREEADAFDRQIAEVQADRKKIKEQSDRLVSQQQQRLAELRRNVVIMTDATGKETPIALIDVVRFYHPNAMGFLGKCGHYLAKVRELLWENPRESNTEGGLFPSIFGTVMLIFLMAVTCFPLGVLAGIYLGEYAKDGWFVRLVRIAVNNLAGIPSIVYGIFGLGFFVYGIGGKLLDPLFFPERVAAGTPTFGTGGILWASLTLGLLTVPVVIVSTEEALRAIPRATREGSYALGATKSQTLIRILVPMASPGMMTGFILAMARAAGEVAPLMITGVIKSAPQMPVDGIYPYFHLDRKFMHLGFQIYDVGFQSPNVEASKPMVYVTTLLLLAIVLAMSSVAIYLRNRMKKRYQVRTI
jgi:phosphate transport system permease protein